MLATCTVTEEAIENLEGATKDQANSPKWFNYRRGRVTASMCSQIVNVKSDTARAAIVRKLMNYDGKEFYSPACKWGKDNESVAREQYVNEQSKKHVSFTCRQSGFFLYTKCHFMGASPDGIVSCKCHENRLLEIKCPYKYRSLHPLEAAKLNDKNYCLDVNGQLKHSHPYYLQVQMQMLVCKRSLCDFVVWTTYSIFILPVRKNDLLYSEMFTKLESFVRNYLLKEHIVC